MSETSAATVPISVLVVDEEEELVRSCARVLAGEGYTVHTGGCGRDALETVRRRRPDVVVADLMLPDMDGLALLKEIKRLAPETLVVIITGFATVDSSVEAIRAGAYDYIPKPFTATQLRILIGRAALQLRMLRDPELRAPNLLAPNLLAPNLLDQVRKQHSSPASVLIAAGAEPLAGSCAEALSGEGYATHTEERGLDALERVRRHRPEVVVVGLALPDMDGLAFVRAARGFAPKTRVLVLAPFGDADSGEAAILLGAYDYLSIPFTSAELRALVWRAARQVPDVL